MATTEQILAGMPDKVQVIIKAPHFVVTHTSPHGIYWTKLFVKKENIASVIDVCENGASDERQEADSLKMKMMDLEKQIVKLKVEKANITKERDEMNKSLKDIENASNIFSNKSKVLFSGNI